MPRYDQVYANLVDRLIRQGTIDIETFIRRAIESGMTQGAVIQRLEDDLLNEGPIFGKFLRGLSGAAGESVMEATRQGELVAAISPAASRVARNRFRRLANRPDEGAMARLSLAARETADPEIAAEIEAMAGDLRQRWVAELVNTCHRCLPLHGSVRTRDEWAADGLNPSTIHDGWTSPCYCRLVPVDELSTEEAMAPLKRNRLKSETGKKGVRKTARAVTVQDVDRAMLAVEQARESKAGRRTLRLLGQSRKERVDDEQ